MTPADEIEYVIKEIAAYENDVVKSYKIISFPEICFEKYKFHCIIEIMEDYRKNDGVIRRFEELRNELKTRKITIENQIVYTNRIISFHGNTLITNSPIYYKECIFTYQHTLIGTNCENCIVEKR